MNWIFKYVRDLAEIRTTDFVYVDRKSRLPAASGGVITLAPNTTYFFTTTVDLTGDRLVGSQNTTIIGGSSESARIISTGVSGALISSAYSLPMRGITITADIALDLDASSNPNQALDWFGVNFTDCEAVGTVKGYSNFIMTDCALLNSASMTFDGNFGTIGFSQCLFSGREGETTLVGAATLNVSRRFRGIYSAFGTPTGGTGIGMSTSATIPAEAYILDAVNFSGAGSAVSGVLPTDNKALFTKCVGVQNTGAVCSIYMINNATETTVSATRTFYKIAGTTAASSGAQSFTAATSNRMTYVGASTALFRIFLVASLSAGSSQTIRLRIGKNGTALEESQARVETTVAATGRVFCVSSQAVITMSPGDYVEPFVANDTATTNITANDLTFTIARIY
jgi:hypothetical protein